MKENKKNNKLGMIILFSLLGILIVIAIIAVVLSNNSSPKYKFIGNWSCKNGKMDLRIDSKKFIMEAENIYIEATYEIDYDELNETPIGTFYKTGLILSATKRVLEGKEYTEPYKTMYEINIEEGKENVMNMINAVTYNMYECYKK